MTNLADGKMLFAWARYDTARLYYKVFNGAGWSSANILEGSGLTSNTIKQISSGSNTTGFAFVGYTTGGTSGTLKVAIFSNSTGTFQSYQTADNTLSHSLPTVVIIHDSSLHLYSISSGKIYVTKYFNGTWIAPDNRISPSVTTANQLTSALRYPAAFFREGAQQPYSLLMDTDLYALESYGGVYAAGFGAQYIGVTSTRPWVGLYHDVEYFKVYKASTKCGFAGTTASSIGSGNDLTCALGMGSFTGIQSLDYGYLAYVSLLPSGKMTIGAEVYKGCEFHQLAGCNDGQNTLAAGQYQLRYSKTKTLSTTMLTEDIRLFMVWTSTGKVTWLYQIIGTQSIPIPFASYTKPYPHFNFVTGKYGSLPTAYYFQVGISSKYKITQDVWSVMVKGPSFAKSYGGTYNSYFTPGKTLQGDLSNWDNTFRWGGKKYNNVGIDKYDCIGAFARGQVEFSYSQSTVSSQTPLWPC